MYIYMGAHAGQEWLMLDVLDYKSMRREDLES